MCTLLICMFPLLLTVPLYIVEVLKIFGVHSFFVRNAIIESIIIG